MENLNDSIKTKLNEGAVSFAYEKKNGEWRNAVGTRNNELIQKVDGVIPSGSGKPKVGVISYWDLNSNGWRCFGEDSIIEIKESMSKEEYIKILNDKENE